VTGFGANLLVIDDPVKNRAQAVSETFRRRVWDWYKDDLYTRLEPDGSIVLIQTRWHEDDLAGRLLRENLDDWTIINLPALSEPPASAGGQFAAETELKQDAQDIQDIQDADETPQPLSEPPASAGRQLADQEEQQMDADERGLETDSNSVHSVSSVVPSTLTTDITENTEHTEKDICVHPRSSAVESPFEWRKAPNIALCPERFDVEALEQQRRQLGTYSFSALYQQRPTPAGGQIFKREWFKNITDFAPPGLKWKRGYDLAVSTRTDGDYTASFRCAFDAQGNLYISGGFRRRIEFPEQRRYIIDRITHERDTEHGIELALHGQALIQDLRRDTSIRGRSLRGVKVSADKLTRALTWSPLAEEGKVILVRNTSHTAETQRRRDPFRQDAQDIQDIHDVLSDTEISPLTKKHPAHPVHPVDSSSPRLGVSAVNHADWISDLLDELTAFPNGTHDDQIDAISLAVHMAAKPKFRSGGILIT
jgi:predicted phage terminase large subunit-like protein